MPETMRAVDLKNGETGPASDLYINPSVAKPVPKASECLIRVHAFGLNRADTMQREGKYPMHPSFPKTLGLEFSGTIAQLGADVNKVAAEQGHEAFEEGEEVFGLAYGGCYAEYVVVSGRMLSRRPKELSMEVCAGLPEVWFTALQALYRVGEYTPGKTKSVLWHAGASSVSIAGIQLARAANAGSPLHKEEHHKSVPAPKVFASTRQDEKCKWCVDVLKADGAVNSTSNGGKWAEELKKMNGGEGVDLIIDFMGGSSFGENLQALARDGRVVILGLMGGPTVPANTDISGFIAKRVSVIGSTLRSRDEQYQGGLRDLFEEWVLPRILSGDFDVKIEKVLDWSQIAEAHGMLEKNVTKGKVVCTIDQK